MDVNDTDLIQGAIENHLVGEVQQAQVFEKDDSNKEDNERAILITTDDKV